MDDEAARRKFQRELNSGAVSLVLLGLLARRGKPMYGYEIAKRLEEAGGGALPMNQGALYPVLRSLEKQGLLASSITNSGGDGFCLGSKSKGNQRQLRSHAGSIPHLPEAAKG